MKSLSVKSLSAAELDEIFNRVVNGPRRYFDATQEFREAGIDQLFADVPLFNPDKLPSTEFSFILQVTSFPGEEYRTCDGFQVAVWHDGRELGASLGRFSRWQIGFAHPSDDQMEVIRRIIEQKAPLENGRRHT